MFASPLRLAHPIPQRQRLVVVPVCLRRSGKPLSFLASLHGRRERPWDVVAFQAVVGKLGGRPWQRAVPPPLLAEQGGERGVQPGTFTGQEIRVHGLAQQRMPERVAFRAVGNEKLLRDRLPDRVLVGGGRHAQTRRGPVRRRRADRPPRRPAATCCAGAESRSTRPSSSAASPAGSASPSADAESSSSA